MDKLRQGLEKQSRNQLHEESEKQQTIVDEQEKIELSEEQKQQHLNKGLKHITNLLRSLSDVFPECQKTAEFHKDMEDTVSKSAFLKKQVLVDWHNNMHPYYKSCLCKQYGDIIRSKIPMMKKLDIYHKLEQIKHNRESMDVVWGYLNDINMEAQLYHGLKPFTLEQCNEEEDSSVSIEASFVWNYIQWINDMLAWFPRCPHLKKYSEQVIPTFEDAQTVNDLTTQWYEHMKEIGTEIFQGKKDYTWIPIFLKSGLPIINELQLKLKLEYLQKHNRYDDLLCFWQYVNDMNQFCQLHFGTPNPLSKKISTVATSYFKKIANGEMDLEQLEFEELGYAAMGQFDNKGLNEAIKCLPEMFKSFSQISASQEALNHFGSAESKQVFDMYSEIVQQQQQ